MTTKITEKNISSLANAGVSWQSVVVADGSTGLTAVAGRGYFINTTSGVQTVTLPASPNVGDVVVLKDYARTWATNNVTISSTTFDGATTTATFSTNGQTVTLAYMDATKGWSLINEDTTTNLFPAVFISATGGTVTTDGDFKIHTFTGDGSLVVSAIGNSPVNPLGGPTTVDYLVVGGGGGGLGPAHYGGGSGAGGFRESKDTTVNSPHTASPLAATTGITVTATTFPITVGAAGSSSVFSTITSAAGGGAGAIGQPGAAGGSGGGGTAYLTAGTGGSGNTPPVSPPQGQPGGNAHPSTSAAGGGGGATIAGSPAPSSTVGGAGGGGAGTGINPSPTVGTPGPSGPLRYFAGGGGGTSGGPSGPGPGGYGGGGNGGVYSPDVSGTDGAANTGGGGGGSTLPFRSGGSGIVIIRYKFQ